MSEPAASPRFDATESERVTRRGKEVSDAVMATLWKPGVSANPEGRPKGSRNKLGEAFVADLYEDWKHHGVSAIAKVRDDKPDAYLKVIASILPKEISVKQLDNLSDDELIARLHELERIVRPFLATTIEGSPSGEAGGTGGDRQEAPH